MASHAEEIRRQLAESARVKQSLSDELVERISQLAEKSASRIARPEVRSFFSGMAAALRMRCISPLNWSFRLRTERKGLASIALTTNPSVLTAAGNDYGFERIFFRGKLNRWWRRKIFLSPFLPAETARIFCVKDNASIGTGSWR